MSKNLNALAWLRYAEEDLDAAELLLRSGFHRHALFWAEQASEKILKVYIITPHVRELVSKIDNIIDFYESLEIGNENIKRLKEMRDKIIEFSDPKIFGHLCGKSISKVERFFDIYQKVVLNPYFRKVLMEDSNVLRKMSRDEYRRVFREVEKLIGNAIKLMQASLATKFEEPGTYRIVRKLQSIEKRTDKVREIILNIVQEVQQKYRDNEVAKEAALDCQSAYLSFLNSITVPHYYELHAYLCQFFEMTRYPNGREIPKDVIENLPQIINLLRENLERVKRLVG